MGSSKKKHKVKKKDSQLIIRINSDERERFINLCEHLDTSAAREIRLFIREFIEQNDPDSGTESEDDDADTIVVESSEEDSEAAAKD
ncbi:hypothetical protein [Halioxenophilus sp. WMMB6]|uniref:hypothetical protein n=1 Tax=Halioxenophilus sp. WMMB6 TaxID=3073815 RepID=UPI00295E6004|nr:hypothetical protein [Halioxenophilus sp. WMMB6]